MNDWTLFLNSYFGNIAQFFNFKTLVGLHVLLANTGVWSKSIKNP